MRVCCYLSSGDNFFCKMVLTSIKTLRQYNKTVKVRVFLIGTDHQTKIDVAAKDLNIEIIRKPSLSNYFCLNRQYLSECDEECVLYIDGDTFIFGDIELLFDNHKNVDFAAATDDYITGCTDWCQENLLKDYHSLGAIPVPVFNGGILLWNNGKIRDWAESLPEMCEKLQDKQFSVTPWLFGNNRDCYHKETFCICFHVAQKRLKYEIMGKNEVVNLFSWDDYYAWENRDFIVYHTFTQNWDRFNKRSRKKIIRMKHGRKI